MPDGDQFAEQTHAKPGNELIRISNPRLPWHPQIKDRFGVDAASWRALIDAVWPSAKSVDAVVLALSYCKARNLDPFKRPVHIVPVWSSELNKMVESVWPGIGELRTTAMRTGVFAGRDPAEFGADKTLDLGGVAITFPEWCQVTVHRLSRTGDRMAYPGPRVYWLETYATAKRETVAPNSMWRKRPRGQLEKCAEAAALRAAFPEEIGNEYAADEMAGQIIEHAPAPPRPRPEDYATATVSESAIEQTEAPTVFEVIDSFGEPHEYESEMDAMEALVALIGHARSLRSLEGLSESNPTLARYPAVIAAYKDQKETFKEQDPGNRQDRPAAGAPQIDPARGATDTASQGRTEHPEGVTQSTQSERRTTQELSAAGAATSAAAQFPQNSGNDRSRDEPKHASQRPNTESFMGTGNYKLPDTTKPKELLYYLGNQYLPKCRDQFDINGIEVDNEDRLEALSSNDRREAADMIAQRRKEIG